MPETERKTPEMTDQIRVPEHVVYRRFAAETVVLNLETGQYYGLNGTAGRMLEELDGAGTLGEAAAVLAGDLDVPREQLEGETGGEPGDPATHDDDVVQISRRLFGPCHARSSYARGGPARLTSC